MDWICSNCNTKSKVDVPQSGCYVKCSKCQQITFIEQNGTFFESGIVGCNGCFSCISANDEQNTTSKRPYNYCLLNVDGKQIGADKCSLLYAKRAELGVFCNLSYKAVKDAGISITCNTKEQFDNFINLFVTLCKRRKYCYELVSGITSTVDALYESEMCSVVIKYSAGVVTIDYIIAPTARENTVFYENVISNWTLFLMSMSSFFNLISKSYNEACDTSARPYLNCIDIVEELGKERYNDHNIKNK